MNEKAMALLSCLPRPPKFEYDWQGLDQLAEVAAWSSRLAGTPQNPEWHGEGDVWTHTRMVCDTLAALPEFRVKPEIPPSVIYEIPRMENRYTASAVLDLRICYCLHFLLIKAFLYISFGFRKLSLFVPLIHIGAPKTRFAVFLPSPGDKGDIKGTPKDSVPIAVSINTKKAAHSPKSPKSALPRIKTNLVKRNAKDSEYDGTVNDAIPPRATTIITI